MCPKSYEPNELNPQFKRMIIVRPSRSMTGGESLVEPGNQSILYLLGCAALYPAWGHEQLCDFESLQHNSLAI
jgi:hypothetical protein